MATLLKGVNITDHLGVVVRRRLGNREFETCFLHESLLCIWDCDVCTILGTGPGPGLFTDADGTLWTATGPESSEHIALPEGPSASKFVPATAFIDLVHSVDELIGSTGLPAENDRPSNSLSASGKSPSRGSTSPPSSSSLGETQPPTTAKSANGSSSATRGVSASKRPVIPLNHPAGRGAEDLAILERCVASTKSTVLWLSNSSREALRRLLHHHGLKDKDIEVIAGALRRAPASFKYSGPRGRWSALWYFVQHRTTDGGEIEDS